MNSIKFALLSALLAFCCSASAIVDLSNSSAPTSEIENREPCLSGRYKVSGTSCLMGWESLPQCPSAVVGQPYSCSIGSAVKGEVTDTCSSTGSSEIALGSSCGSITGTPTTAGTSNMYLTIARGGTTETIGPIAINVSSSGQVPNAAANLSVTSGGSSIINGSFTDYSNVETGVYVQRSSNGSTGWATVQTLSANATTFSDFGLAPNTTYYYRVIAFNGSGSAAPSNVDSATTSGTGGGTLTACIDPSRTTGPAPLAVRFDAMDTTHTDGSVDIFNEVVYSYSYDDASSGTWEHSGKSKNSDCCGPIAAHVFDTPGTYDVTVTATDVNGASNSATVQITVQDPDVFYAGTNTVCVSTSSNYTGCPSGASHATSMPAISSNKRILLRGGETFGGVQAGAGDNDWMVGKYGTGTPTVTGSIGALNYNPGSSTAWPERGVFVDLNVQNKAGVENSGKDILFYRLTLDGRISVGTSTRYYYDNNAGGSNAGYKWPRNIFVVETYLDCQSQVSCDYNVYGAANGWVVMGNHFIDPFYHNIRLPLAYKSVVAHNKLDEPGSNIRHFIKLHGKGLTTYADKLDTTTSPASQYVVIRDNHIGNGETIDWAVAVCPMNSDSAQGVQDVIVERNYFQGTFKSEVTFGGRRLTARNTNTASGSLDQDSGCHTGSLPSSWNGPYYLNQNLPQD